MSLFYIWKATNDFNFHAVLCGNLTCNKNPLLPHTAPTPTMYFTPSQAPNLFKTQGRLRT